jgi:hypothetical protein
MCWILYRSWTLCWSTWKRFKLWESLCENNNFNAILELDVELQDILQELKKLHNVYSLPEGDLAHLLNDRKKEKESKVLSETESPQRGTQSRNAPSPTPQPQPAQTDKAWRPPPAKLLHHHGEALLTSFGRQTQRPQRRIRFAPPTTSETLTPPRRGAFDCVRSAHSAPAKTDQIRPSTTTSETSTPRKYALNFDRHWDWSHLRASLMRHTHTRQRDRRRDRWSYSVEIKDKRTTSQEGTNKAMWQVMCDHQYDHRR